MAEVISTRPPSRGSADRALARLGLLLSCVLVVLLVTTAISQSLPAPARERFDRKPLERLRRRMPDVVLIGNSMVYTRFDEKLLGQLVQPTRVALLTKSAGQSALWYAQLKNYVAASGVDARKALIFFRDRELTLPALRAKGAYARHIQRASAEEDPVIARKTSAADRGLMADIRWRLSRLVPIGRLRAAAASGLEDFVLQTSSRFSGAPAGARGRRIVNDTFRVDALRDAAEEPQASWDVDALFGDVVEASFLPDMLAVAKQHSIALTFVRVRRRRTAQGSPEKPGASEYQAELRRYLEQNGATYVDLSPNRWESLDMYASGDHISARHRKQFTRLFVQHYPQLFRHP